MLHEQSVHLKSCILGFQGIAHACICHPAKLLRISQHRLKRSQNQIAKFPYWRAPIVIPDSGSAQQAFDRVMAISTVADPHFHDNFEKGSYAGENTK
jgi:hypothetical protein